jgi:hypothetical protein
LEGREKVLGMEYSDTLINVSNLALVFLYQGKYEAVEEMNRRALKRSEKMLRTAHFDTLVSINNLALMLRDQGKYEKTEKMHRRQRCGVKVDGRKRRSCL